LWHLESKAAYPLHLLHVVHQYLPENIGGTELYTRSLAKEQLKAGHEVAIFTPVESASSWPEPAVEEGIRVYRFPVGRRSARSVFFSTFGQQNLEAAFVHVLESESLELVHLQHLMGLPAKLSDLLQERSIPYVITLHDYWYGCANAQLITNYDHSICEGPDRRFNNCGRCALFRAGQERLARMAPAIAPVMKQRNKRLHRVFNNAQVVIAPSNFVRKMYGQLGLPEERIVVVPHGIDQPPDSLIASDVASTAADDPEFHVGYVGSLAWQKGVHNLIAAFNRLPQQGVRLSIYGSLTAFPDYVAQLRQLVQHPAINIQGTVTREELWKIMKSFDVLVLPTLWYEGSPLTIQEAFAVRVPIVASRIGAMEEKIRDEVDGLLVAPNDVDALEQALRQLIQEPEKLERLRSGIRPIETIASHASAVESHYLASLVVPES
jgi:glycosyltransferase involved in cell wall biosynthesis